MGRRAHTTGVWADVTGNGQRERCFRVEGGRWGGGGGLLLLLMSSIKPEQENIALKLLWEAIITSVRTGPGPGDRDEDPPPPSCPSSLPPPGTTVPPPTPGGDGHQMTAAPIPGGGRTPHNSNLNSSIPN